MRVTVINDHYLLSYEIIMIYSDTCCVLVVHKIWMEMNLHYCHPHTRHHPLRHILTSHFTAPKWLSPIDRFPFGRDTKFIEAAVRSLVRHYCWNMSRQRFSPRKPLPAPRDTWAPNCQCKINARDGRVKRKKSGTRKKKKRKKSGLCDLIGWNDDTDEWT